MSQQKQIVPNRVLLATAVFAFIASNQKPEDSVLPELVLVIFYALFFVHRHYRRDPKNKTPKPIPR
jgi:ABC-type Fe3+ transport system permease subunit